MVGEWERYQITTTVLAKEIMANQKSSLDWGTPRSSVDFLFRSLLKADTFVTIHYYTFPQTSHALQAAILDSTIGFTTILNGLKELSEHVIHLNSIAGKFPQGHLYRGS